MDRVFGPWDWIMPIGWQSEMEFDWHCESRDFDARIVDIRVSIPMVPLLDATGLSSRKGL